MAAEPLLVLATMAPKASAKKKPSRAKAGAKAAGVGRAPALAPKATPAEPPSSEAARRRAQLGRRDTDQQIERAMLGRLDHLPKGVVAAKRNAEGQTIREFLVVEIKRRRTNGGKLGSRFWSSVYDMFDLRENLTDNLPPPTDDEVPSAELLDVLATAHNDNPIKACVVPLERYLGHSESLGQTPTFGLLRAVQVGPTLPHHAALRAQLAVLKFWARTGVHNLGEVVSG